MAPNSTSSTSKQKVPLTVPLKMMKDDDIVITGISARLPESENMAEFREHLINEDDMITADDRRWETGEIIRIITITFQGKV